MERYYRSRWQSRPLNPGHDAGATCVRLSGAWLLYHAQRWARTTRADPFVDAGAAGENTAAARNRRLPYTPGDRALFGRLLVVGSARGWSCEELRRRILEDGER